MDLLLMEKISKSFFGKLANHDVSFQVRYGEIHGLLGENGAGKTTLMNILYGIYTRDKGDIYWKGAPICFDSPKDAIANGIGMVHQHFMLVPTLTVSQNITLGLKPKGYPLPNRNALNQAIEEISAKYSLNIEPNKLISALSVGEQQRVEIVKLLYRNAELLILDEPTAMLTPQETAGFFRVLKELKKDGKSVIIITHKIPEIMEITDRVTVLRDGKNVAMANTKDLSETELSQHMIGRPLKKIVKLPLTNMQDSGLCLKEIFLKEKERCQLNNINLCIHKGEIMGLAGVEGNGQKELAEALLGIRQHTAGSIFLEETDVSKWDTLTRKQRGMAYISDDRHKDGLVLDMSLPDNMMLKYHCDAAYQKKSGLVNYEAVRQATQTAVEAFDIKTPGLQAPLRFLSGGNQQKLILAREIEGNPSCVIAFQPTRGLDIGATEFIHQRLLELRNKGCSILLISSDLDEILALSDTIAVLYQGRIMDILPNQNVDLTQIGMLMAGVPLKAKEEKL